jgi:hypothetical protein
LAALAHTRCTIQPTNPPPPCTEDGIALRGLFIIDKEGVVQHSTINNLAFGRSVDETLRTLQVGARVAAKAAGAACHSKQPSSRRAAADGGGWRGEVWTQRTPRQGWTLFAPDQQNSVTHPPHSPIPLQALQYVQSNPDEVCPAVSACFGCGVVALCASNH